MQWTSIPAVRLVNGRELLRRMDFSAVFVLLSLSVTSREPELTLSTMHSTGIPAERKQMLNQESRIERTYEFYTCKKNCGFGDGLKREEGSDAVHAEVNDIAVVLHTRHAAGDGEVWREMLEHHVFVDQRGAHAEGEGFARMTGRRRRGRRMRGVLRGSENAAPHKLAFFYQFRDAWEAILRYDLIKMRELLHHQQMRSKLTCGEDDKEEDDLAIFEQASLISA